ncbi:hypothetical protein F5Y11DRAFT_61358 [Daldinia sp. FL1419]|nr:hypothetical protein F5Y11DRAFT_61358 [Daldinia sp. FL1419]
MCIPIHWMISLSSARTYIGASTIGLTLLSGDASSHLPLRMVSGWDMFCETLESLTGSETERELDFISKITMRMIKQAIDTHWPIRRLPTIVRNVFPKTLDRPMLQKIAGGCVRGTGVSGHSGASMT